MTRAELETNVNQVITDNANNEITASILRPLLLDMIAQINDLTGDLGDLNDPANTLVEAINNIDTTQQAVDGLTIYTGVPDPNFVSPSDDVAVGHFYSRTSGGTPYKLYIFDGQVWRDLSLIGLHASDIALSTDNWILTGNNGTVIYVGISNTDTFSLPDPLIYAKRKFTVVNQANFNINFAVHTYKDFTGANATVIPNNSSITVQSNGVNWYRIQ